MSEQREHDDGQATRACSPIPAAEEGLASRLCNPLEIRALLKQFALAAVPLTLHAGDAPQPVVGRVLRLDVKAGTFSFGDGSAGTVGNPPSLAGRKLFVASQAGARLQFAIDSPVVLAEDERAGYIVPFPEQVLKLQRREFNRLEAPLGRSYIATFSLDGRTHEIHLYDLSLGGVGLRTTPQDAEPLHVGRILPQVKVEFGTAGVFVVDIEIRLRRAFSSGLLGEQVHIGCRMLNLNPASKARLRSLLARLEREHSLANG